MEKEIGKKMRVGEMKLLLAVPLEGFVYQFLKIVTTVNY